MARKVRLRLVPVAATLLAALVYACAEQTGPGVLSGWFAIAPVFTSEAAGIIPVSAGRFVLRRTADGTVVKDTVITLGAGADSVDLTLTVPLLNTTETFELTIGLVGPAGDTVFRAGPLTVAPATGGDPPPLLTVPLTYTGTGAAAAGVVIASPDTALFFGGSILLQAQALDSAGQPIPGTPIEWRSLDTARVRVPAADSGRVVGNLQRGVARIVARLLTGQADTVQVAAQPVPNSIAVDGGNSQFGPPGIPLAQLLVARVLAADGLGVENVWVRFTVTAGGGLVSPDSALTGPDGRASATFTLGNSGGQVVEATTALLSGATAVFGATVTAAGQVAWVNPAGGNWSVGANWSTGTPPSPTDTALITLVGTYAITLDTTVTVARLLLGAPTGSQTLTLTSRSFGTTDGIVTQNLGTFVVVDGSLAGPGSVTQAGSGSTLVLRRSVVNTDVVNQGTIRAEYVSNLNGTLTQTGTLFITNDNFGNGAAVGVNGFTNEGTIRCSGSAQGTLSMGSGTLVNAPGATIDLFGPAGCVLSVELDNRGTVLVNSPTVLSRSTAQHLNSGTITVGDGALLVFQQFGSPSFTNTGTLTVGPGRTLAVSGTGTFNYAGGTLGGTGLISLRTGTVAAFTPNFTLDTLSLELVDATLGGPGTLTVASGRTLVVRRSTINADLVNQGIVRAEYLSNLNGAVTNTGTLVVTNDDFGNGANFTVATGFTNQGTIQFTGGNAGTFTVAGGTMVNAPGATLTTTGATSRTLAVTLDNQGTVQIDAPTTLNKASAQHINGGTLTLGANDLTIVQSGTSPGFTTSGTLTIGAGRTLTVSGAGTFDYTAGALQGTGLVSFQSGAVGTFTPGFLVDTLSLELVDATLSGPGEVTVAAGATLLVRRSTVNAGLVNQGLVQAEYLSAINGSFTQTGTLIVTNDNFGNGAALTVATGFVNEGAIQFTGGNPGSFTIAAGALVNAAGATFSTLGASARNLTLVLVNQGTVQLDAPTTLNQASAPHASSGTLILGGGDLTVTQSGTAPSFTTTGTLTVGAGRTLTVGGGTFSYGAGTLGGTGLVSLQSACSAFFTPNFTVGPLGLEVVDATLGGAGTVTVSSGATLLLRRATLNANLVNLGTVQAEYLTAIQAPITQQGLLIVTSDNFGNPAAVTAPGFTNSGTVQLTGNGTGTFTTSGTLTNVIGATVASIGSGSRVLNTTFSSGGTLQVDQPLTLNNTGVSLSDLNGSIALNANLTLNQDAGETFANSGAVTIGAGTTFDLNGGSFSHLRPGAISGTGTLDVSGTSVPVFQGDVNPGTSPGALAVTGALTQNPGSIFRFELNGTTPGTQYDQLNVSGVATLQGTIALSLGFTPQPGNVFNILTFGSRGAATLTGLTGTFDLLGTMLDTVPSATALRVEALASVIFAGVDQVGLGGVWRARPTGGLVARITPEGPPASNETHPRWSPDRTRITYSANPGTGPNQLHIASPDGLQVAHPTGVTDVDTFRPRFNRTGQRIAFGCDGLSAFDQGNVCVIPDVSGPILSLNGIGDDAVGGKVRVTQAVDGRLTSTQAFAWDPVNEGRLVVARDSLIGQFNRPASQLWFVNFNGLGAARLTPTALVVNGDTLQVEFLDWAPNGTFIVFSAIDQQFNASLYRVEVATGAVTQLTFPSSLEDDEQPVISPDNSTILFIRNNFALEASSWNLWRIPVTGGSPTQITAEFPNVFFGVGSITYDWSPDGSEIVLTGSDGNGMAIYVIDAATTPTSYLTFRRLISRLGAADVQPSWRP